MFHHIVFFFILVFLIFFLYLRNNLLFLHFSVIFLWNVHCNIFLNLWNSFKEMLVMMTRVVILAVKWLHLKLWDLRRLLLLNSLNLVKICGYIINCWYWGLRLFMLLLRYMGLPVDKAIKSVVRLAGLFALLNHNLRNTTAPSVSRGQWLWLWVISLWAKICLALDFCAYI